MTTILQISIPCPLRQLFDYLSLPEINDWKIGMRVKINFANRQCIGIVLNKKESDDSEYIKSLKTIESKIDDSPLLTEELIETIIWMSRYYHHPIGECFQTALPKLLRSDKTAELKKEDVWFRTETHIEKKLSQKQRLCIDAIAKQPRGISNSQLKQNIGNVTSTLKTLESQHFISRKENAKLPVNQNDKAIQFSLNTEQERVVEKVWKHADTFESFLLEGITGSGKTEVYIELAERVIARKKQVLILIPEIGLTGQFVERFKKRLDATIVVLNSSVSAAERKQGWLLAKHGLADVIIGTRSAVFTPLARPGLILIDEEHDASYKQQDGLRYHARNIALIRAQKLNIPIMMGSATPSLESLFQVKNNKYQLLELTKRAGGASLPRVECIDSSQAHPDHGLSQRLLKKIEEHTRLGNQVILFINRRGFAPVLMCHECQWQAKCDHCDARMVVHQHRNILFCHHCGYIQRLVSECPQCQSSSLKSYGQGTEKIEQHLQILFPDVKVLRIDRDSTQRVNAFNDLVEEINEGEPRILVGTQMLAKGHDFHNVTLVGVLDADQGLYSADFRATENLAQLITQVTGRAGRGDKSGEVFIQSEQAENPFWKKLIQQGYKKTALALLNDREEMDVPPVSNWIMIRAESFEKEQGIAFLSMVSDCLFQAVSTEILIMGPVPAIMEKKAGRYRAQLLLSSATRKPLHQLLDRYLPEIEKHKLARKVRWSIDVDPVDIL